jgi:fibronectin-binding autotransporter adhesin
VNGYTVNTLAISNANAITVAPGTGGTLTFAGITPSLSAALGTGHVISAPVILNASTAVTVGGSSSLAINGNIASSGAYGLTLAGGGPLTLGGADTYTGPTAVNAGTLAVSGSLSGTAITVAGGALIESVANALAGGTSLAISSGSATLSQANNYNGGTTVSGGTLSLAGAGSSNTGTGPVAVGSGAVLAGNGTVGGNLTAAGRIVPHTGTSAATLNVGGSLILNAGSLLDLNFGAASGGSALGTSDQVLVAGALTVNATTISIDNPSGFGAGRYKILGYGSLPGGFNPGAFSVGANPGPSYAYFFSNNSGEIDLNVWIASVPKTWTGSISSNWDTTTANWAGGLTYFEGNPAAFQFPDTPVFTTGAKTGNVNVASILNPAAMVFSATDQPFTLSGSGQINTSGGITSTATQPVTINLPVSVVANQTWTNNGTGLLTAAGPIDTSGGGIGSFTLTVGGTGNTLLSGVISGGGGLTGSGPGTLTLINANSYTGNTTASGGTLTLDFTQPGAPARNIVSSSSPLALAGGVLNVIGNGADSQSVNGTTINVGASSLIDANNGGNLLVALGAIARNPGGTVDFSQPAGTLGASNGFTTSRANNNGILGGWATVGGASWATNNGGNIVALPAASYTYNTWGTAGTANVNFGVNSTQAGLRCS